MTGRTLRLLSAGIAAAAVGAGSLTVRGDQTSGSAPGHVVLTNQQDRQRMMDILKITSFPSGPGAYLASTYDENTANPYPHLPDPLLMNNGTKVTSAAQWRRTSRRDSRNLQSRDLRATSGEHAESDVGSVNTSETTVGRVRARDQATHRQGRQLGVPGAQRALQRDAEHAEERDAPGPGGPRLRRRRRRRAGCGEPCAPPPAAAPGASGRRKDPVAWPTSLGAHPAERHAHGAGGVANVAAGGAARAGGAGAPTSPAPPSAPEQIYARGWGYATVSTASIQADNGNGLTCGIIGLVNKGQPRKIDDWGVLSAWGWGMSKVLDYLETDKAVDATSVAVHGHSRTGKAALVAMAYDERFANGFISSSGQAGAKLHRRKYGESIENIAALNEYHWMAGNYLKYTGRWDQMPVDAHELVALVAPRPVFLSTGKGPDTNPDGSVKMMEPGDPGVRRQPRPARTAGCQHQRRVGRSEGHVPRRRRRGTGLQAARQEGPWHDGIPADRDWHHGGRRGVSPTRRRATHPARTGRCSSNSQPDIGSRRRDNVAPEY